MLEKRYILLDGVNNGYSIYNNGEVHSDKSGKFLKKQLVNGYYIVFIKGTKVRGQYVHKLVARYFMDNYDDRMDVTHMDRNLLNNEISNLKCVERFDNENRMWGDGNSMTKSRKKIESRKEYIDRRYITTYTITHTDYCGNFIRMYDDVKQAYEELGISKSTIWYNIKRKKYKHFCLRDGGYWKLYNPDGILLTQSEYKVCVKSFIKRNGIDVSMNYEANKNSLFFNDRFYLGEKTRKML